MKKQLCFMFIAGMASASFVLLPKGQHESDARPEIYHHGWIDLNKNGKKDIYEDPAEDIDKRIDDLLSRMTIDEKTCQMVTLYGYKRVLKDSLPTADWKNEIWKDGIGAIDEHLNGFQGWGRPPMDNIYCWPASNHAKALNEVQRFFIEDTRLGIPADFTNEGIRGVENYKATNFPTQLALGQTWDRELIRQVGYITGEEARLLGYTNVYAPILDVARDQRWGRMEESYGESPFLVAELGIAMTKGMQTNYQVASTAKHYAIYSNNKGAREGMARADPQIAPRETWLIHLYPFKRVIRDAGLLGVMSSYNDYDGIPIQGSYYYLTEILRNQMGFHGYIVSDSDAVIYLYNKHHTASDYKEAVRQAVEAGLNVRCTFRSPDSFVKPLRELVKEGKISEKLIDQRVRDILRVKFLTGQFDHPYMEDYKKADEVVNGSANQQVALQASRESIVLLKNSNNTLPLDANRLKRIAVIGPNADDGSYALGHYGPLGVEVSTVLDGIKAKAGNRFDVVYAKGCDIVDANWPDSEILPAPLTDEEQAGIADAVNAAQSSDLSVVVLGGGQRTCGENKSRSSLNLPGRQLDLIKAVYATGKPVVLVVISGRPLSINWSVQNIPAILQAFYPGSQGGKAIADVLFGDYNPGGKLTVTIPKTVGQIPFNFPAKPNSQIDAWGQSGLNGSRARVNGALFPFGFGLSYTDFVYTDLRLSAASVLPDQNIQVSFRVKNVGKREGDEVVQLYLRDLVSSVTTYEKVLRGFDRVRLKPGEEKKLNFTLTPEDLSLLDKDMKEVVEPGRFRVMAGASSEDIRLQDEFEVVSEDDRSIAETSGSVLSYVHASDKEQDLKKLFDKDTHTSWETKSKDAYIDFELKDHARPDSIAIQWADGEKVSYRFEIQLSGGGGQFIRVFSGTSSRAADFETYRFKGFPATDLRLVFHGSTTNSKVAAVSGICLSELKY